MHGAGRLLINIVRMMILLVMYPFARLCQNNAIPILAYHSVDDNLICPYSLSVGQFQRQIEYLKDSGYRSISLHELIMCVRGGANKLPLKGIVLTFDDGFKDFRDKILPILKYYGFSAVLSIVGNFCISGKTDFYHNGFPVPALSWDDLRDISAEGIEIASHSMSHVELTSIPLEQANWEIWKSRKEIEAALNTQVDLFCYPHGACNDKIADLVEHNGYKAAMTTSPGLARKGDNVYRLTRVPVGRELSINEFKVMLTPAVEWYSSLFWGKIGRACGFGERQIF